jgi:sulfate adenylyltransferase subunit 2
MYGSCVYRKLQALEDIIQEVAASTRVTERGTRRIDDKRSEAAMEDSKKAGYF